MQYSKHEIVNCNKCLKPIECKANNNSQCECNTVIISNEEAEYISELQDGCLCVDCLNALKEEYNRGR